MSSAFDLDSVDAALKELKGETYEEVRRILYGKESK